MMNVKTLPAIGFTLLGLAGCASTTTPATVPPSTPALTSTSTAPTSSTPTSSTPTSSTPASTAPGVITLDEHANHTTVTVGIGTTIRIDLHSTYWSGVTSSAPTLVHPTGTPVSAPSHSCVPGSGCGIVTTTFTTPAAGTAQLADHRTSCGEARPCTADEGTFTVTIKVTA